MNGLGKVTLRFVREVRRLLWTLLTVAPLWWLGGWIQRYGGFGDQWLRNLVGLNKAAIGLLFAHLTFSQLFYYADGEDLYRDHKLVWSLYMIARALYYVGVAYVVGVAL